MVQSVLELSVEYRRISSLRAEPKNARLHDKRQLKQIAESIKTFGFNVPILIDQNMNVIAGHGRLLAVQGLGWQKVPTIQLSHLTSAISSALLR